MEASEKPQLPLDAEVDGTVRALDDRLVIEQLTVTDERAAQLVRDRQKAGQEPARTVANAIEIGARVLDREDVSAEADYVRAELERYLGQLADGLEGRLEEGSEALAEQLAATFGIDRSDSVQQQLREMLVKANEHQRTEMVRLFNAEDGTNPLADFKTAVVRAMQQSEERRIAESQANREQIDELTRELVALRERQLGDERLAEAEEAGTRKGRSFEELVHGEIEALAADRDAAQHVGDTSTESGGKKGDTVVELGGCDGPSLATVVFEAKNRRLSKNDAWAELNDALSERDAAYAVLVVAGEDKVPAGLEDLVEYQGNKMIAVMDRENPDPLALRLVYRYVRAKVLATQGPSLDVDAAGVRAATEEARAQLKNVNRIRKSLTNITNSADRARDDVDKLVSDVEGCLARVESLVSEAEAES